MYWDSDVIECFGVGGFKKKIPKHRFVTLWNIYILLTQPQKTEMISSAKLLIAGYNGHKSYKLLRLLRPKKTFMAILWGNWRARKKVVPCARKLAERGMKATPSKYPTGANSVALLYVTKCGVTNHVLPSGIL